MAAINFPDSPSDGDTHVVGGVTYTYNNAETKWKTTINSNAFLPLTGGTVSGNILMGGEIQHDGDTDTNISFDTDTILFDTAGSERFRVGSAGQLGIGGATYGTSGQVLTSGGASAAPQWASAGRILNVFTDVLTSGQVVSVNNGSSNTAAAWSGCDLDLTCSFSNSASNCIIIADIKWGGTFNFVYRIRDATSNQIVLGQQGGGGANQQANSSGPAGSSGPNSGNQFSVASNTSVIYYNPPSNSTTRQFVVEFLGANNSGNVYLGRTINNDNGLYAAKAPCTLTVLEVAP